MAAIIPFRAVMPAPAKAPYVVSHSFESYSAHEMAQIMTETRHSFLHVINPSKRQKSTNAGDRAKLVREKYEEFIRNGILIHRPNPALYLYEQSYGGSHYRGLFCAASTADYRNNVIKCHEATLAKRELLFARYLQNVRFNAEPVLMMYPDSGEVSRVFEEISMDEPDYDFRTPEGKRHRLWIVEEPGKIFLFQDLFARIGALYIADGHHRTASSSLMAQKSAEKNSAHTGNEAYNFFMSCLLPESEINIHAYTRLVRDLSGHSATSFLSKLKEEFEIDEWQGNTPAHEQRHTFGMYLDNRLFRLRLKGRAGRSGTPLDMLDSQILYTRILRPLLGIDDLRNDKRLEYRSGTSPLEEMKELVDRGKFALGFTMNPIDVSQIKAIAEAGQLMPPKSTYIEPKLLSGLTIYEF